MTLNITGWRECKASLTNFITPAGGEPLRDLGQIIFVQFMITRPVPGAAALDIQLGDFPIERDPERTGDVKHSLAAIDRLWAAGFTPTSNFANGLSATIQFFQNKTEGKNSLARIKT
ncbi:MAG: hypothetical protein WCJ07_13125 [Verrucomicrobiota bacterium]